MVSTVKCVSLMIHRPVPLGQVLHYMLIKKEKERNPAIRNDVDGTRGYCAERNKSVRERQLHMISLIGGI